MPVSDEKPILVNGAGIAGLSAAIALGDAGYQVVVHEKAEGFETIGAGIQLSPNATRILTRLGLASSINAAATEPECIELNSAVTGRRLARIPLGNRMREKFGYPYQVIHRADLQAILASRCRQHPNVTILLSSEVIELAPFPTGLTVMYTREGQTSERSASAVIAADGVWSRLRTRVLELPEPVYSGKVAWRALIPSAEVSNPEWLNQTTVWFGKDMHVVCYPVRNGDHLNIVIIADGPPTSFGQQLPLAQDEAEERFSMPKAGFTTLLKQKTRWTGWPIFETPTDAPAALGPVGLIGDAAHAMLPFAAQGAAMAIEDAAVLADCFLEAREVPDALALYAASRRKRIAKMAKASRRNGQIYHLSGFPAFARDSAVWLTPSALLSARQNWIYGWKG